MQKRTRNFRKLSKPEVNKVKNAQLRSKDRAVVLLLRSGAREDLLQEALGKKSIQRLESLLQKKTGLQRLYIRSGDEVGLNSQKLYMLVSLTRPKVSNPVITTQRLVKRVVTKASIG